MMKFPKVMLWVYFTACVIASVSTHDPLQPIWDQLDHFPGMMLQKFESKLTSYTEDLNLAFDNQVASFKSQMNASSTVTTPPNEAIINQTNDDLVNNLIGSFHDLYTSKMESEFASNLLFNNEGETDFLSEVESKISKHLDQKLKEHIFLLEFNYTLEDNLLDVAYREGSWKEKVDYMERHVTLIWEMVSHFGVQDVCSNDVDEVRQYIKDQIPSQERIRLFENLWDETYEAVTGEFPNGNPHRDCSDILFANPDAVSGVYDIFPSRDPKRNVTVWCDMETKKSEDEPSGWTVMLRRRNTSQGLLNFNRSWEEYSTGFGQPGNEGEWWLGLTWLHQLTYYQPYQVYFQFHDIEDGDFFAHYGTFRVESESRKFRLVVDDFIGVDDLVDAFKTTHHGQPFSTADRDNDNCTSCNCAFNNQGGWWYNVCHRTVLTAPFPTSKDRDAATIRWLSGKWLVLDDVTMMVRPTLGH